MQITTVGIDLAKNIFHIHGITSSGKRAVSKALKRADMLPYFAQLPPCLIGLESCGSAHYWQRELSKLGHDVRLINPAYVKPFVKRNKNDARDAETIYEVPMLYKEQRRYSEKLEEAIKDQSGIAQDSAEQAEQFAHG